MLLIALEIRGREGFLCGHEHSEQWTIWNGRCSLGHYEVTDQKNSETNKQTTNNKQIGKQMFVCLQAEHVSTRVQFGNKLETYGIVQEKIAHMALRQYVTEVQI